MVIARGLFHNDLEPGRPGPGYALTELIVELELTREPKMLGGGWYLSDHFSPMKLHKEKIRGKPLTVLGMIGGMWSKMLCDWADCRAEL
jgi:hypothetical protein